jgi:hypothetical protein
MQRRLTARLYFLSHFCFYAANVLGFCGALFFLPLTVFVMFFWLDPKEPKNQGKTRSLRAFLPSPASPCVAAHFFTFYLLA